MVTTECKVLGKTKEKITSHPCHTLFLYLSYYILNILHKTFWTHRRILNCKSRYCTFKLQVVLKSKYVILSIRKTVKISYNGLQWYRTIESKWSHSGKLLFKCFNQITSSRFQNLLSVCIITCQVCPSAKHLQHNEMSLLTA